MRYRVLQLLLRFPKHTRRDIAIKCGDQDRKGSATIETEADSIGMNTGSMCLDQRDRRLTTIRVIPAALG